MAAVNVGVPPLNQSNFLQHSEEPAGQVKSLGGPEFETPRPLNAVTANHELITFEVVKAATLIPKPLCGPTTGKSGRQNQLMPQGSTPSDKLAFAKFIFFFVIIVSLIIELATAPCQMSHPSSCSLFCRSRRVLPQVVWLWTCFFHALIVWSTSHSAWISERIWNTDLNFLVLTGWLCVHAFGTFNCSSCCDLCTRLSVWSLSLKKNYKRHNYLHIFRSHWMSEFLTKAVMLWRSNMQNVLEVEVLVLGSLRTKHAMYGWFFKPSVSNQFI